MKIKLVTFAPHPNYGTCLQSYALNKVLRDLGHDVEFIYNGRETPPLSLKRRIGSIVKFILPSSLVNKIREIKNGRHDITDTANRPPYILHLPNNYIYYIFSKLPFHHIIYKSIKCRTLQWRKVYEFTFKDHNFKMKRLYIKRQYDETVADADLFITGSDQIWNPYCGGFNPMMFLEFAGHKKRVAYSSSIARPYFPKEVEQRAKNDLIKFKHIAVREQSSVELLNKLLNRDDVRLVVDPTYLLSKTEWEEFGTRANIEFELPEKYIFCYFIGKKRINEYEEMIAEVKRKTGIERVIAMNCTTNNIPIGKDIYYKDGGPYEFIYILNHASYICMDSFHATIFALKFEKEFVHILKSSDNNSDSSQNTRIYDLFERYGILYKIYEKGKDDWYRTIDFCKIDKIMEKEVQDSLNYLNYELEN